MRLTSQSLTIFLCLIGGQAFAPHPTRTLSVSVKRWASSSSELSGLLNEYKSVTSPGATSAVSDFSSPVTTVVTQPDALESSMKSLTDAVTAATDAADQASKAASAAMAAASKTTAATKASVATATAAKTVTEGVQVLPGGFQFRPPEQAVDASSSVNENFATLKANFLSGMESLKVDTGDAPSLDLNSLSSSPIIPSLVDSLHLKDYGGWYVAAAMAITASQQRSAGREEASKEFESELELARAKASEAASAAGLAAEGARLAKSLAMKMEGKASGQDAAKTILESSRVKAIEVEKEFMEKELNSLKTKVVSLEMQIAKLKPTQPATLSMDSYKKTEIEEEYPTIVTIEPGPEEDARVVELLKEMDEENKAKKLKTKEELEKKREEESKYVAKQKAAAEKAAKEEAARLKAEAKKAEAAKAEAEKAEAEKMARDVEEAQANAEKNQLKSIKKGAEKTAAADSPKKASKKTTKSRGGAKVKSATMKSTKTAVLEAPTAGDGWQSLSDATLKRKTIAEITAYLTERGVRVTDDSGKVFKKAELVAAVKSL